MKYIIISVVVASLGLVIYGFGIQDNDPAMGHKCIGFGTSGLFLVAMPLFLVHAGKGKKVKDYMLTEENIRKMQAKQHQKGNNL